MISKIKSFLSTSITSTIILLIALTVLFNIERLDFGGENLINISSFVYVLATVYLVAVLLFRQLRRLTVSNKVIICLAVYGICKTLIFDNHPIVGGIYSYISILEIFMLSILVILAHKFTRELYKLDHAFKNNLLADIRSKNSELAASQQVAAALNLSRRHGHSLSLAVVEPIGGAEVLTTKAQSAIIPIMHNLLRASDLVMTRRQNSQFVIVCQLTTLESLKKVLERIQVKIKNEIGVPLKYGTSCLPENGLTLEDLVAIAETKLNESTSNVYLPENSGKVSGTDRDSKLGSALALPGWLNLKKNTSSIAGHKYKILKRAMDISLVLISSVIWFPLLCMCATIIKICAPMHPVIIVQKRTGKNGHMFNMYKFRTMVPNADNLKAELAELNQMTWPDFKVEDDPRITPIGNFLRKTSLDELPEMFNVLKGDMSLVGPRPTSFTPQTYRLWQTERLDVKPGVTGLWQILGRGVSDFEDRVRLDIAYIKNRSLWLDLQILIRTIPAVLSQRGAY